MQNNWNLAQKLFIAAAAAAAFVFQLYLRTFSFNIIHTYSTYDILYIRTVSLRYDDVLSESLQKKFAKQRIS